MAIYPESLTATLIPGATNSEGHCNQARASLTGSHPRNRSSLAAIVLIVGPKSALIASGCAPGHGSQHLGVA